MMRAFLSYHFSDGDRQLAASVKRLLGAHGFVPVTGEALAGQQLTESVRELVHSCDILVALMTPESPLSSGGYRTHPWVRDEVVFAIAHGKATICLIDPSVEKEASLRAFVWIDLDRPSFAESLIALSTALGNYKVSRERTARKKQRFALVAGIVVGISGAFALGASVGSGTHESARPNDNIQQALKDLDICAEQEPVFACRDQALRLAQSCGGQQ